MRDTLGTQLYNYKMRKALKIGSAICARVIEQVQKRHTKPKFHQGGMVPSGKQDQSLVIQADVDYLPQSVWREREEYKDKIKLMGLDSKYIRDLYDGIKRNEAKLKELAEASGVQKRIEKGGKDG